MNDMVYKDVRFNYINKLKNIIYLFCSITLRMHGSTPEKVDLSANIVRAGVNYKF
mgnify:CR=1 FL=1